MPDDYSSQNLCRMSTIPASPQGVWHGPRGYSVLNEKCVLARGEKKIASSRSGSTNSDCNFRHFVRICTVRTMMRMVFTETKFAEDRLKFWVDFWLFITARDSFGTAATLKRRSHFDSTNSDCNFFRQLPKSGPRCCWWAWTVGLDGVIASEDRLKFVVNFWLFITARDSFGTAATLKPNEP